MIFLILLLFPQIAIAQEIKDTLKMRIEIVSMVSFEEPEENVFTTMRVDGDTVILEY